MKYIFTSSILLMVFVEFYRNVENIDIAGSFLSNGILTIFYRLVSSRFRVTDG